MDLRNYIISQTQLQKLWSTATLSCRWSICYKLWQVTCFLCLTLLYEIIQRLKSCRHVERCCQTNLQPFFLFTNLICCSTAENLRSWTNSQMKKNGMNMVRPLARPHRNVVGLASTNLSCRQRVTGRDFHSAMRLAEGNHGRALGCSGFNLHPIVKGIRDTSRIPDLIQ